MKPTDDPIPTPTSPVAARTGVCGALVEAACSDDFDTSRQSQVVVRVAAGTTSHTEVASFDHLTSGPGEVLAFNLSFEASS
jgi:hypothetical protein